MTDRWILYLIFVMNKQSNQAKEIMLHIFIVIKCDLNYHIVHSIASSLNVFELREISVSFKEHVATQEINAIAIRF